MTLFLKNSGTCKKHGFFFFFFKKNPTQMFQIIMYRSDFPKVETSNSLIYDLLMFLYLEI